MEVSLGPAAASTYEPLLVISPEIWWAGGHSWLTVKPRLGTASPLQGTSHGKRSDCPWEADLYSLGDSPGRGSCVEFVSVCREGQAKAEKHKRHLSPNEKN